MTTIPANIASACQALGITAERLGKALAFDTYSEVVNDWNAATRELDYADNHRETWLDYDDGVEFYLNAEACGCCGFFSRLYKVGERFLLLGCNYGH